MRNRSVFRLIASSVVALAALLAFRISHLHAMPVDGNHPPHADAGANQKVGLYPGRIVSVTLDGSKSYDADGGTEATRGPLMEALRAKLKALEEFASVK